MWKKKSPWTLHGWCVCPSLIEAMRSSNPLGVSMFSSKNTSTSFGAMGKTWRSGRSAPDLWLFPGLQSMTIGHHSCYLSEANQRTWSLILWWFGTCSFLFWFLLLVPSNHLMWSLSHPSSFTAQLAGIQTPQGLAHGSVGQQSRGIIMRHCINCCIQLSPDNVQTQQVSCRGGSHHGRQDCPVCKAENKIVFRVDGKQMNLLAVLEVRADGNESWGGFLRFKKGKRCSLVFGLIIMTLVMASYILSGVHQELLISSPFHYGAFPSNPSLTEGENPSDAKEHHHQSSVNNISYVKDYPSIKLIINSITSRIEFTTRQLPDIEELKKQELHVSSLMRISVDWF